MDVTSSERRRRADGLECPLLGNDADGAWGSDAGALLLREIGLP